jgi:hypothetical protein
VTLLAQSAPLFLLYESSSDEVARRLERFTENSPDIHFVGNDFSGFATVSLTLDGIVFSLKIQDHISDIATYKNVFCNIDYTKIGSSLSLDLGDNVKGGETIAPIIKGLLALARILGEASQATHMAWRPAMIISSFGYFAETVKNYENGGAFPVLSLINFDVAEDGIMGTSGLAFLSTQELAFSYENSSLADMTRRLVRITNDIAINGPITDKIVVQGLDNDELIELIPTALGTRVFAKFITKSD